MSFLNAEWRKLAMANYAVNPSLLAPYVPAHTELDLWEGKCYVSLVGFMFLKTRLLGIPIPFHRNFEEVNLRFYVRHKAGEEWRRGVVFVKEIVPKPALSWVANTVYKEHYETLPMAHDWTEGIDKQRVSYRWQKGGRWHELMVETYPEAVPMAPGSEEEFIAEHYWGYTQQGEKTFEYEVTHPSWDVYPVKKFSVDVDFASVYGEAFGFLSHLPPTSVLLAEGSAITVEGKRRIA